MHERDALAHAWLRLLLHGTAALTVARIGERCGLPRRSVLLAGLLFGAGPIAFTPVHWASGIQELLGTLFTLLAVEHWLAGGRRGLPAAAICGLLGIFSKESAFGLPGFLALLVVAGRPPGGPSPRAGWAVVAVLAAAVVGEGLLVLGHFARGAGEAYATGGSTTAAGRPTRWSGRSSCQGRPRR